MKLSSFETMQPVPTPGRTYRDNTSRLQAEPERGPKFGIELRVDDGFILVTPAEGAAMGVPLANVRCFTLAPKAETKPERKVAGEDGAKP